MVKDVTIIKPKKSFTLADLKEVWAYRQLFYTFAWRDVKVKYKQTVIGVAWAVIQPFVMMVVFSVVFGRIAGISSEGIPYPIFSYSGLLFWNYFSNSLGAMSGSLVGSQSILQKIYFPRLILPFSSTLVNLVDFFFAFLIFIGLMAYYHFTPSFLGILLLLPALILTILAFTGLGLLLAAVNVKYRDVRYALPFFLQILIFVTPVIYPTSILGKYQWLWYFNPMTGIIEMVRASLLLANPVRWDLVGASFLISIILCAIGISYFNSTEKYFADIV